MKKKFIFRKIYFFIIAIVLLLLLVGISLFKKPENVKVCSYLLPYSIVSEISSDDYLTLNLLVNSKKTFYTDIKCIDKATLFDDSNSINLIIDSINISGDKDNLVNNEAFYTAFYKFKLDFKVDSEYYLELEDANVSINYTNGLTSTINIGSFSYYKYQNDLTALSLNNIKPVTNNDSDRFFYGFQFSIRNISEYSIVFNDLDLLDVNLENYKLYRTEKIIDSYDKNEVLKEASLINDLNDEFMSNEVKYYVVMFDLSDYDLSLMVESLGLSFSYIYKASDYKQTLEKFTFYENNKILNERINVYEYAY